MRQKLEDDRQTATRLLHVARAQHAHGPVKETDGPPEQGQYNTIHLLNLSITNLYMYRRIDRP